MVDCETDKCVTIILIFQYGIQTPGLGGAIEPSSEPDSFMFFLRSSPRFSKTKPNVNKDVSNARETVERDGGQDTDTLSNRDTPGFADDVRRRIKKLEAAFLRDGCYCCPSPSVQSDFSALIALVTRDPSAFATLLEVCRDLGRHHPLTAVLLHFLPETRREQVMRIFSPKETGTPPKTAEQVIHLLNVIKASRHDVASQIEMVERVAGSSVWLRETRLAAELFSFIEGSDVKSVSSAALLAMVKVLHLEKATADILSLIAGKIDTIVHQSGGAAGEHRKQVLEWRARVRARLEKFEKEF